MGGCDEQGNPITVAFGKGGAEGDTYLADGDRSEDFWLKDSNGVDNHDHYGPGNGINDNGTQRGKYTGYGS